MPDPILLYDGVCGLCNRLVQFILRWDTAGVFRFASLQSELAGGILLRHGADSGDLDTVYVVVDYELPNERLVSRSDAVIFVLKQLGAGAGLRPAGQPGAAVPTQATPVTPRLTLWRAAGFLLQLVPRAVRDWGYRVVAHNRYRLFGCYDSCPMPSEDTRDRFLDP
jgi:predicted DCC family thiol-disulfide oxidoreductase YuxK